VGDSDILSEGGESHRLSARKTKRHLRWSRSRILTSLERLGEKKEKELSSKRYSSCMLVAKRVRGRGIGEKHPTKEVKEGPETQASLLGTQNITKQLWGTGEERECLQRLKVMPFAVLTKAKKLHTVTSRKKENFQLQKGAARTLIERTQEKLGGDLKRAFNGKSRSKARAGR